MNDYCMSNWDHHIVPGAEDRIKAGETMDYPGAEFYGEVSWDGQQFVCLVKSYLQRRDDICGDTLESIMEQAIEQYGSE